MNMQPSAIGEPRFFFNPALVDEKNASVRRKIADLQLRITRCPRGIILSFNMAAGAEAGDCAVAYVQLPHATPSACSPDNELSNQSVSLRTPESTLYALGSILLDRLQTNPEVDDGFAHRIAAAICLLAQRHQLCTAMERDETGGLTRWQEERAKSYMEEQLGEPITVDDVAKYCGMSASHLARSFRVTEGVPPYRWLIRKRIEQAQNLLENTPMPLVDISMECGFAEQSHFTRAFRREVGVAPGNWRRVRRTPTSTLYPIQAQAAA